MSEVELFCAWYCPFAQRAWMALIHKGVPFKYIEQDPYNKSPEWLAINPLGLVPTIRHKGKVIYESGICVEYVDETWSYMQPSLLPKDSLDRAHVRMWSDHVNKNIVPYYYKMLKTRTTEEQDGAKEAFYKGILSLQNVMSDEGPFFLGKDFGLVDIMLWPFVYRAATVCKHYRGFDIPEYDPRYTRFNQWRDAVTKVDAVKKTYADEDKLVKIYGAYAEDATPSL